MRHTLIVSLLAIGSSLTSVALAQEQRSGENLDATALRKPFDRFAGTVILRTKDGKAKALNVVIRNWIIDNRRKVESFPERGLTIVELRGGDLTTVIDGKRQQRKEGEFWTVPAGSPMAVETGNDSAIVQTMSVRDQR